MSRALVLGGGGPVGVAWEAGLLAGLAAEGVDLTTADRIVGTSAGSLVGAHIASGLSPDELFATSDRVSAGEGAIAPVDVETLMAIGVAMFEALTGGRAHGEIVADLGRVALAAETITEADFVALVAEELAAPWPDRDFACTAFDVESGEFRVWDAAAGVPLDRAVASSCAVPGIFPPITISGRRYMDGGVLSGTNAHLVAGHDPVVVVSVMSRAIPGVEAFLRQPLDREVADLRAAGATVEVVELDDVTIEAAGGNLMDFASAGAVRATGLEQGKKESDRIGAAWG
jgi:NTE family protein